MREGKVFLKIRALVMKVPYGKVTTYGIVAKALGIKSARVVGWALMGNSNRKIPCHRVIKARGYLAPGYSLNGWREQKKRLMAEGITFLKPNQADLNKHFWSLER